jgi:hypothetical protein
MLVSVWPATHQFRNLFYKPLSNYKSEDEEQFFTGQMELHKQNTRNLQPKTSKIQ